MDNKSFNKWWTFHLLTFGLILFCVFAHWAVAKSYLLGNIEGFPGNILAPNIVYFDLLLKFGIGYLVVLLAMILKKETVIQTPKLLLTFKFLTVFFVGITVLAIFGAIVLIVYNVVVTGSIL